MRLLLSLVAALFLLMPAASFAETTDDEAIAGMTDLLLGDTVRSRLEQMYWTNASEWLSAKGPLTNEQLAAIREAAAAEIPGAYAFIIPPAYAAMATVFTPAEAREILATYVPAEKEAYRQTPLGQKMNTEGNAAFGAAMNGPVQELIGKRLGNYRYTAYAFAIDNGYLPKP